ncbi:retrovirus-related Pol polyprotein from transposon 412 [Trichonephila clavipes]|uniref:Retrovirus-related Pol polyprotein from transposon 412 n=1 Tax=Trichonephila clavipes TaxID=2585209 RepID=A0A8X6RJ95_TRICX|nr:retrovirus-related Pol polyprotein from transposon 412 [Trichonephila clavipes]
MEQQIAELLRQNQELIQALQNRDHSCSHKITIRSGEITNYVAKLKLKPGVKPMFCRIRTAPFAIKGRVENKIDRLERMDIIEKVESSEWATPVVPVVKTDGSLIY